MRADEHNTARQPAFQRADDLTLRATHVRHNRPAPHRARRALRQRHDTIHRCGEHHDVSVAHPGLKRGCPSINRAPSFGLRNGGCASADPDHLTRKPLAPERHPQRPADEAEADNRHAVKQLHVLNLSPVTCRLSRFYKVRPTAAATFFSSLARAMNFSGSSDCGPPDMAISGVGWTSMISPSAPAATAALAIDPT